MYIKVRLYHRLILKVYRNFKKKNTDIGLFDGTSLILDNFTNIDDILILYETEKVLLPLMIHENYYKKIFNTLIQ